LIQKYFNRYDAGFV